MATVRLSVGSLFFKFIKCVGKWALPVAALVMLAGCKLTGGVWDPKGLVAYKEKDFIDRLRCFNDDCGVAGHHHELCFCVSLPS